METRGKKIENRIKAVLANQKRTCRWLASEMGRNENIISRWCSNKAQPSLQQLFDMANLLHVNISTLIRTSNEEHS